MTDKNKALQYPIDLIMVEDSVVDAELIIDALGEVGLKVAVRLVEDELAFCAALDERLPAAILSDWSLPNFSGHRALEIALERCPDVPLIFVSGTISESFAFEAMRQGASDYVFKHQLDHLGPALTRALNEAGALRALRESESRLRTLLQTIPDLVWLKDADGVYMLCNRMVESLCGAKEKDIVGKTDYDFVDKELADSCHDSDQKAIAAVKPTSASDWVTFAEDGRRALMDTIKTPMFDANGKLIGVLGIARDVTEHHNLEEQLRQAQKMEAVGTLAGGVAHDFNNILSAILGYSHLILDEMKDNDTVKNYVEEIMVASKRASVLTYNLLSFSRKQAVILAVIDLSEVIKSNEAFLCRLIREDIELKITCTREPLTVLADRGQIEQVIMNLVTNARDAMPNGGKLSIETQPVTMDQEFIETHGYGKAGAYVMISVSDSGVGMNKETQLRIFEPFYTTKEQGQGTGLGLSMAYGIVKKHDGFINVYSEPGKGTIFRIYLPREQAISLAGKIETRGGGPLRGGTETILVGEDDDSLRRLSKKVLGHYGYQVIEAVDGQDAVDKFIEYGENIDLVLLDAIMPKKNGREACQEMRTVRPSLKVVFVSGYTKDIFTVGNALDGNSVFIQKPFSPDMLVTKVREMLDK